MTGTAKTEEDEFREIYNMDVVVIPTNKPLARIDENDTAASPLTIFEIVVGDTPVLSIRSFFFIFLFISFFWSLFIL